MVTSTKNEKARASIVSHDADFHLREPRYPLVVQVVTEPLLPDCWSVNVSQSGIGLVAAGGVESVLREGQGLGFELSLPGVGGAVRGRGTVVWMYGRTASTGQGVETALGVAFDSLAADSRVVLERWLREHRFQVAVVYASPGEREVIAATVSGHADVHLAADEQELLRIAARGDISAVIVCGDDGREAVRVVDRMYDSLVSGKGPQVLAPDLLPAVIFAAAGSADEVVPLFNSGRVFRALFRPLNNEALLQAVEAACGAHGQRTEQSRVAHALERAFLRDRSRARSAGAKAKRFDQVVHQSRAMVDVLARVRRVAGHKVSVLLHGETGTGKEVLAKLIHDESPRGASVLVTQDCGAIPETLLESELFGHVAGAFTGAIADSPGLFTMADGGTIFLDEIENMSADLQAKLLRVIETGVVRPVGGARVRHVDVRVIAATNRDLRHDTETGRFRADLFYRLNTFPIRIPPLRERQDDILPLAHHFREQSNAKLELRVTGFAAAVETALLAYGWPGNARELRNAVEFAMLMCEGAAQVELGHLPEPIQERARPSAPVGATSLKDQVARFEKDTIAAALTQNGGVIRRAARQLHTNAVTLRRKALSYGLAGKG
ncbi:MAG: sigma 54-interacting transcriptional regulator [Deltaproteobacteria bacterium]|nr:sigma 54-interacting transcriptional regulator [Deltaproteobacteria bacterium]